MEKVVVLMSTYNGEEFIEEQLESLFNQEQVEVQLVVRDDGSTDNTRTILERYKNNKKLTWYSGDNLKPAFSFLDLVYNAPEAKYYAFCDQDDVWKKDKLFLAVSKLNQLATIKDDIPLLYCSDYQLVDKVLNKLPENGHFSTTDFESSLIASNATGCTIVFNQKLLSILNQYKPEKIVMHDDWCHKVCLSVGGRVIYDRYKSIYYRQHGNNADGGVHSKVDKIKGVLRRIKSKDRIRSQQLKEIQFGFNELMLPENKILIELFSQYEESFLSKLKICVNPKITTQSVVTNIKFKIAILCGYF